MKLFATLLAALFVWTVPIGASAHPCGGNSGRHDDERWTVQPNTSPARAKVQICIDKKECGLTSVYTARVSVDKSEILVGVVKGKTTKPTSLSAAVLMTYAETRALMATVKWSKPRP